MDKTDRIDLGYITGFAALIVVLHSYFFERALAIVAASLFPAEVDAAHQALGLKHPTCISP
jgi:hypothetical protein